MEPVSGRQWMPRYPATDYSTARDYAEQLGVADLVARLLIGRQFSIEAARQFLAVRLADLPDPFLLPDMDAAVKRLHTAIEQGEKIAVHGDYDVDGIAGTALLTAALEAFGAAVEYHIPLRLRDGYGLSGAAIKAAAAQGVAVLVSVDCGVSSHEEAVIASQHGVDLIVTDHHQPPSTLPQAVAVINPQREDSDFPFQPLAGVGVAFFLLIALRKSLREAGWFAERPEPDLRDYLDLVALGTIADLVPLRGVNRIMARHGLVLIENRPRIGLRALKQIASVKNVSSGVVAFQLAPRLNAAGRMEDAALGVDLLLGKDMVQALHTAHYLDQCNRRRQELEQQTLQEAEEAIAVLPGQYTHTIVLGGQGWHPGVIGIVASRIVERYHRPAILVALDGEGGKGSARSIRGYHLYRALQACADHLIAFGGHEMAAGLSIGKENLPAFASALEAHARGELGDDELLPRISHDGTALLEEIDLETLHQIAGMAPFGMDNPEPLMVVESVRAMRIQELKGGHLRFTVCQGAFSHPAIAFGMVGRREELRGEVDLLVAPQINYYHGRETVQLRVKDVRQSVAVCADDQ